MPQRNGHFPFGTPDHRSCFPLEALAMPLLRDGGVSVQRQPIPLTEHSHNAYELHVLLAGAMPVVLANGRRLPTRGGQCTLTQPGQLHGGEDGVIPKSSLLWLTVDPRQPGAGQHTPFADSDLKQLDQRLRACGNRLATADDGLLALAESCRAELARWDAGAEPSSLWQLRALLPALVIATLRCLEDGERPQTSEAVAEALRLMADSLDEGLSVEGLAAQVGLSPSRFHELFKAETGLSPADHHLRMRIGKARQLLHSQRNFSMAAIATESGFRNPRHFATVFKRFTGQTPSAWRDNRA